MRPYRFLALAACLLALLLPSAARAGIEPSSTVLVPYFEVDVSDNPCRTTYFAVSNHSQSPHEIEVEVRTNWGIPVLTFHHSIAGNGVFSVNLADWLLWGHLPFQQLSDEEIAHLQAALAGKPSPRDNLYYGTQINAGDWAVGSVRIRVLGTAAPDVLWGDYFIYCTKAPLVQGETLVNLDKGVDEHLPCTRHGIRFLDKTDVIETELMFWSALRGAASRDDLLPDFNRLAVVVEIYDESGELLETRQLHLLPAQVLPLEELELPADFGWLQLTSSDDFFVTGHMSHMGSIPVSLGLHSYCLPEAAGPGPGIDLIKRVNGQRAGSPPGVNIAIGGGLQWEYTVTNTGAVTLTGVGVEDDDLTVICPKDTLEPGESMVCTASSQAIACGHRNVAVASGTAPDGTLVQDDDVGFYYGNPGASIDLEKLVEGLDADFPPGPRIRAGTLVSFTYVVTNTGATALTNIAVSDDQGFAVTCPKSSLEPGESMTCTAQTTAVVGSHRDVGTVTGVDLCAKTVRDEDPGHYLGWKPGQGIAIEKLTNGMDADAPPGPELQLGATVNWSYQVTNTGEVALHAVAVVDDRGVAVSCPKTTLEPGESMTCIGAGLAAACQYRNVGTATGLTPEEETVSAQDPSHYFGQHHAAIALEKRTNGQDADVPPGPGIPVGDPVQWTYVVTNTGDVALTNIVVSDDHDALVSCPKTTLQPAESMTCTASGTAVAGQYGNVGAVTADPPCGDPVSAEDPSHYIGQTPDVGLEKLTNGEDADTPPGPNVLVGSAVLWTYVVTNTGNVTLSNVAVTDSKGVAVTCPKTQLAAGESMTCTASGTAVSGQYANVGTVTGTPPSGGAVTASDPSHYFGESPGISLEKRVNGQDADTPPGPTVFTGDPVNWTYVVTNTGDVRLTGITVTDDRGVVVSCPKTALEPGESMTCTASGTAVRGQYSNIGTATGTPPTGPDVTSTDPAHYFGVTPSITIVKLVNGEDANTPPGPVVPAGDPLVWSFVVTNTGDIALSSVTVTDSTGLTITCPKTTLQAGESMTCTASGIALEGLHTNVGTASGTPAGGDPVTDSDPCNYTGWAPGNQGCSAGYWKNHTGSWPPTGYSTSQDVDTVFANVNTYYPALGNASLLEALSFAGGSGGEGAAEILLRAAVAALLNASHPAVAYPRTAAEVIADVNTALLQNRDAMLTLAAALDADNNGGCPLH